MNDSPKLRRFRPRYTIIDHENSQTHLVGGPYFVLFPASNFADYAAMKTVLDNVDPDMGLSLQQHLAHVDRFPDRTLSKYGIRCIPHIKDPILRPQARAWAKRHGIYVPPEEPPQTVDQLDGPDGYTGITMPSSNGSSNGQCPTCGSKIASAS